MSLMQPHILITDDDPDFRETLSEVFSPLGFHTHEAGDGEEALEIVKRESVHLVLLDMHMPKLSGLETLQRVKSLYQLLPCILLSGRMDDVIRKQAERANAFSILSKPVTRGEITDTVQLALEQTYGW